MFAIAAIDAMPRNYSSIIFTGTHEECMDLMDPQGLEGSVEDLQNKVIRSVGNAKERSFTVAQCDRRDVALGHTRPQHESHRHPRCCR